MKCVDLTHSIHGGMPRFMAHWHCEAEVSPLGRIADVGRNTTRLVFGSHCGTHVDAPLHFVENGTPIDEIPVSKLVGPVSILDFRDVPPGGSVSLDRIKRETLAERMVFHFGWADMWERGDFYNGYPFFSDAAAEHIVSSGVVKFVGMDTPSPDDSRIKSGSPDDSKIHKLFLSAGIVLAEYLDTAGFSEFGEWNIAALPIKVRGCDGAPARVVVFK